MKVINPQISPRKGAIFRDSVSTYENLLKKARLPTLRNRRLQDCKIVELVDVQRRKWPSACVGPILLPHGGGTMGATKQTAAKESIL